ncbi:hypothetical protein Ae168Ps1_3556 [Pseudonocardia sp. Ae168_Ps1]|nr:hypothetical protein Ae168Ps1_3556 [Pseudonocardia sp. Ae168_Ps1]
MEPEVSRPTGGVQPSVRPKPEQASDTHDGSADPYAGDDRADGAAHPAGPGGTSSWPGASADGPTPADGHPRGGAPGAVPPRPRSPDLSAGHPRPAEPPRSGTTGGTPRPAPPYATGAAEPSPTPHPGGERPTPAPRSTDAGAAAPHTPQETSDAPEPSGRSGRRARRDDTGPDSASDPGSGSAWLQQEIARRVAGRSGESGRHARVDPARGRATTPQDEPGDGASDEAAALPRGSGATRAASSPAGTAAADDAPAGRDERGDDAPAPSAGPRRPSGPRPRSTRMPDPYAPEGVRDVAGTPPTGPGPSDSGKQWPPADGGSGLPRRVPGASSPVWDRGWSPDPDALHAGAATENGTATEEHPETRPVPTRWTAAGRRSTPAPVEPTDDAADGIVSLPGPAAFADPAGAPDDGTRGALPDDLGDLDDGDDLDDDDTDDAGRPHLPEHETERTEVIWRAPGLDAPVAPAPAPDTGATPAALTVSSPAPYTGARPRRFAAAPTDAPAPEQDEAEQSDEGPGAGRVRIVLSERRSTAHSSRGLSDVQDPGAVGTLLRNSLVRTQLLLTLRVSLVALFGIGMLPALFMAVPALGGISVLGIRLPWLLLGVLVYPFLLGLGWWYVRSAETAEQEFAEDVADR